MLSCSACGHACSPSPTHPPERGETLRRGEELSGRSSPQAMITLSAPFSVEAFTERLSAPGSPDAGAGAPDATWGLGLGDVVAGTAMVLLRERL
eukprot:2890097-Prymnesium_polylepis.1